MKTKDQMENDNLAQVQGYPDFASAPKGTTESHIQKINDGLEQVYSTDEELFMFHDYMDELTKRAMEDPEYQEQMMRAIQCYG